MPWTAPSSRRPSSAPQPARSAHLDGRRQRAALLELGPQARARAEADGGGDGEERRRGMARRCVAHPPPPPRQPGSTRAGRLRGRSVAVLGLRSTVPSARAPPSPPPPQRTVHAATRQLPGCGTYAAPAALPAKASFIAGQRHQSAPRGPPWCPRPGLAAAPAVLPQLDEQRLGAELGMSQPQSADGLKEAVVGHPKGARASAPAWRWPSAVQLFIVRWNDVTSLCKFACYFMRYRADRNLDR